jgi:hypothetical protein
MRVGKTDNSAGRNSEQRYSTDPCRLPIPNGAAIAIDTTSTADLQPTHQLGEARRSGKTRLVLDLR